MVGELIRLRFAIQRHTLGWKRLLGLVLGVTAAAGTWAGTLLAAPGARADVLLLVLAVWLVGWVIGPILTSGASVLRPEYFTLLPLERRRLGAGLLASVFVGVGAAVTTAGMLALAGYGAAVASGPRVLAAVVSSCHAARKPAPSRTRNGSEAQSDVSASTLGTVNDALLKLLDDVRPRGALFDRSFLDGPWSLRFEERPTLAMAAMLRGDGWITRTAARRSRSAPATSRSSSALSRTRSATPRARRRPFWCTVPAGAPPPSSAAR